MLHQKLKLFITNVCCSQEHNFKNDQLQNGGLATPYTMWPGDKLGVYYYIPGANTGTYKISESTVLTSMKPRHRHLSQDNSSN